MADHSILYSAPMVLACLAGRKSQTRRILKPQPHIISGDGASYIGLDGKGHRLRIAVGDRLYAREAYSGPHEMTGIPPREWPKGCDIWYWADGNPEYGDWTKPKPGMHMPRWASRFTQIVTDVRVQRLQDISEADAIAEGGDISDGHRSQITGGPMIKISAGTYMSPIAWYHRLWDSINEKAPWDLNPWVVAYTFETKRSNIDV